MIKFAQTGNVDAYLQRLGANMRKAGAKALTQTAFAVGADYKDRFKRDLYTPWVINSVYAKAAERDELVARVGVAWDGNKQGRTSEKTVSPHFGKGKRVQKGFERAFQRARLMPDGWVAVPARDAAALKGVIDQYGNIRSSFLVMLITYFNASGTQGHKANMLQKTRDRKAKVRKSADGYKEIQGVVYFVSLGRSAVGMGDKWVHSRMNQHLAPGIWAKSGVRGSSIKPVIMFVKSASYRQKFNLNADAMTAMARDFPARFRIAMSELMSR